MQAIPEPRQQTFEEIYAPPENFLEIEVRTLFPLSQLVYFGSFTALSIDDPSYFTL